MTLLSTHTSDVMAMRSRFGAFRIKGSGLLGPIPSFSNYLLLMGGIDLITRLSDLSLQIWIFFYLVTVQEDSP